MRCARILLFWFLVLLFSCGFTRLLHPFQHHNITLRYINAYTRPGSWWAKFKWWMQYIRLMHEYDWNKIVDQKSTKWNIPSNFKWIEFQTTAWSDFYNCISWFLVATIFKIEFFYHEIIIKSVTRFDFLSGSEIMWIFLWRTLVSSVCHWKCILCIVDLSKLSTLSCYAHDPLTTIPHKSGGGVGSLATYNFISLLGWRWMRSVLMQQLNSNHCYLAKRYFLSSGWEQTHHRLSICIIMYVPRVSNPLLRPHNVSFNIVNERMYEWIKA